MAPALNHGGRSLMTDTSHKQAGPQPGKKQATQPQSGLSKSLKRLFGTFKLCMRTVFYVPLFLIIALAVLLSTPFGSHLTVFLADKFVPGLSLEYQGGVINRELSVTNASWRMSGIEVEVDALSLQWNPACLFYKQICAKSLTASGVVVNIDTDQIGADTENADTGIIEQTSEQSLTKPETDSSQLPTNGQNQYSSDSENEQELAQVTEQDLRLPIDISLSLLELNDVHVRVNDMTYSSDQLRGQAIWNEPGLQVDWLTSQGLNVNIPLGSDEADANASVKANSVVKTQADEQTNDSDTWAMADLPLVRMPFAIFVKQLDIQQNQLTLGSRTDNFAHIALRGSFIAYHLTVDELAFTHDYGDAEIKGEMHFTRHYPMDVIGNFNFNQVDELPGFTDQQVELQLSGDFSQLQANTVVTGETQVNLEGKIDLTTPELNYAAKLSDSRVYWPLAGEREYQADIDTLVTDGNLTKQNATIKALFQSPFHGATQIEGTVSHQAKQLKLTDVDLRSKAGHLLLDGELSFGQSVSNKQAGTDIQSKEGHSSDEQLSTDLTAFSWRADVIADHLIIEHIEQLVDYDILSGNVNGQLTTSGNVGSITEAGKEQSTWQVSLFNADLDGELNANPFTLKGDIDINHKLAINANHLEAQMLGSNLRVNGQADEVWDIDAELTVPDLSLWVADTQGTIQASIDVNGAQDNPVVDINASIDNADLMGYRLQSLLVKGQYQPLASHLFNAQLDIEHAMLAGVHLAKAQLTTKGDQHNQNTQLTSDGDLGLNVKLISHSDLEKQQFEGHLDNLDIDSPIGFWRLQNDIVINWDNLAQQGSVTKFCLGQSEHLICSSTDIDIAPTGSANLQFAGEPGKLLQPYLPRNLNWQGHAAINLSANWFAEQKPNADLTLILTPGSIQLEGNESRSLDFDYQQLKVDASLANDLLNSSLNLLSQDFASAQSNLSIDIANNKALSGSFTINQLNLLPLVTLFPHFATLEGTVSADLDISGTLESPVSQGEVRINDGALALTANPTLINHLDATLQLSGQQGQLQAAWQMGEGKVTSKGDLAWGDGDIKGDIHIKGDKLAIIQPPLAILDVSPDVQIVFDTKQLDVKGDISIPSGQITIVQLSDDGIAVSDDVVYQDSISELEKKSQPYLLSSNLNINVGDQVSVDGMGLQGSYRAPCY
ncbi:hypothetical protein EXU30_17665 [Shewanella maritima]|uniref:Translocation and assembly module TamB C-terminal domain-containing protein n=1 Tax=Shewanella maritima TaxID=2520507 RepID=A0A411PL81_9GAMM|nr:hypothetical protein EXU30_17665 [Shewanella maritima]